MDRGRARPFSLARNVVQNRLAWKLAGLELENDECATRKRLPPLSRIFANRGDDIFRFPQFLGSRIELRAAAAADVKHFG
jgi:hypothetical protein